MLTKGSFELTLPTQSPFTSRCFLQEFLNSLVSKQGFKAVVFKSRTSTNTHYYINTNEIASELLRENISSHVKITSFSHVKSSLLLSCYGYI